jgi:hypothetical protein
MPVKQRIDPGGSGAEFLGKEAVLVKRGAHIDSNEASRRKCLAALEGHGRILLPARFSINVPADGIAGNLGPTDEQFEVWYVRGAVDTPV